LSYLSVLEITMLRTTFIVMPCLWKKTWATCLVLCLAIVEFGLYFILYVHFEPIDLFRWKRNETSCLVFVEELCILHLL